MSTLENLILIYGIHYKVMTTIVPELKEILAKYADKWTTTLFLTNRLETNVLVPKIIMWD